jgi:hypothetical protein
MQSPLQPDGAFNSKLLRRLVSIADAKVVDHLADFPATFCPNVKQQKAVPENGCKNHYSPEDGEQLIHTVSFALIF